jgi:multicomponent Na+:H+ antiporter subunit G
VSAEEWAQWIGFGLAVIGVVFFTAGTAGLLRFPDALSRLHALAKADNLGMGFVALGMALQAGSASVGVKLVFTWLLALLSGATCAYLIAGAVGRKAGGSGD